MQSKDIFEGGDVNYAINGEMEMQDDIYKVGKDGMVNKSRREQSFKQDITKQLSAASTFYKPPAPEYMKIGEYMFTVVQLVVVLIYALCTKYDAGVSPDSPATKEGYDPTKDLVQKLYPLF